MKKFNTVELNVTFYRLLKKEAFERWYKETPPDFSFCLKGSRFISHVKKLKDVELPLATFFNATAPLMEKLEVVLWQLPPTLKLNMKNLEDFVETLKQYPVRHVFEFRHKSWLTKKVFNLLSSANIAVCMADWPEFIDDLPVTADFVYIRRHGERGTYDTDYTSEQLKKDARRIKDYLKAGKDVYCYFNNDAYAHAPKNAAELRTILEASLPKSLKEKMKKEEKAPVRKKKRKPSAKTVEKSLMKPAARKAGQKAVKKTAKKVAKKTAGTTKKAVKKTAAKASAKPAKKTAAKKAVKKTAAKKTHKPAARPAKKAVKKTTAKKAVKKAAVKKATTKKTTTKKTTAKKTAAKKTAAKKTARKAAAKPVKKKNTRRKK